MPPAALVLGTILVSITLIQGPNLRLAKLAAPLVVSYSLYRLPVWFGADDRAQFEAWSGLVIVPWYLAGASTSAWAVLLLRSLRK